MLLVSELEDYTMFTFHHVAHSFVAGPFIGLLGASHVLENINIWSKMDHVLLSTTVRHLNERVQIANGRAQNVTFREMFALNMQQQTDNVLLE